MIRYKAGYKYQLLDTITFQTKIIPDADINHDFMSLDTNGLLTVKAGYAYDGPSGPTFDTKNFMRGSLAHDALYQMMGDGVLSADKWREEADRLLVEICKEDGMSAIRRAWVYAGVRVCGERMARKPDVIFTAP